MMIIELYYACNIVFKNNKHFFEIKIININDITLVTVGVLPSNSVPKVRAMIGSNAKGWGFCLKGTKKSNDNGLWKSYGKECKNGDTIKCECDFDNKTVKYYINNISQGIAFNDLNGHVRPAVSIYTNGDSIKLLNVK